MNLTLILEVSFIIAIGILVLVTMQVYGQVIDPKQEQQDNQTEIQTRTFEDCYKDTTGLMALGFLLSADKIIDFTDLRMVSILKNIVKVTCEFYHEKLGIWINPLYVDQATADKYKPELYERYQDSIFKFITDKYGKELADKYQEYIKNGSGEIK